MQPFGKVEAFKSFRVAKNEYQGSEKHSLFEFEWKFE